jgi:hypothetical protein
MLLSSESASPTLIRHVLTCQHKSSLAFMLPARKNVEDASHCRSWALQCMSSAYRMDAFKITSSCWIVAPLPNHKLKRP